MCGDCGREVGYGAAFCPHCHEPMEWEGRGPDEAAIDASAQPVSWIRQHDRWGETPPVVDDGAPVLYSRRAIYVFSFLFTALFGAVMMAINLRELNRSQYVVPVLSFAVAYLATVFLVAYELPGLILRIGMLGNLAVSAIGAQLLVWVAWKRFIGQEIYYRKRSIVPPLLIGIGLFVALVVVLVWAILASRQ